MEELSADESRRVALAAQGLLGATGRRDGVAGLLRRLGAVQLDTIAVLARSHELVPYARLGPIGRREVESAYWGRPVRAFEYWGHAASVLAIEDWPLFEFRRRAFRARGRRWHRVDPVVSEQVRARLAAEGPLTASELGGAKAGGPWWDWSSVKVAVEWLWDVGTVAVVERRGWRRVYDLAERAVPADLLAAQLDDEECFARLVARAGAALGIATRGDLADYFRLSTRDVDPVAAQLVPVRVEGWREPAWASPAGLAVLQRRGLRHRTTLLSPFDSLVWNRARTERVFGFQHRLEAYVPSHRREHGYFAMPLLAGGRLVGRVDPSRRGRALVARRVSLEGPRAVRAAATALREAAAWVGSAHVTVERVVPERFAPEVLRALA